MFLVVHLTLGGTVGEPRALNIINRCFVTDRSFQNHEFFFDSDAISGSDWSSDILVETMQLESGKL